MSNLQDKGIVILIGILVVACVCCCGSLRVYNDAGLLGVEYAARKVGAEPATIYGIAKYIEQSVEIGMSREEVERILGAIAPLEVVSRGALRDVGSGRGPTACDEMRLKFTPLPGHYERIVACYDSRDELVLMHFVGSDAPALEIYKPVEE